MWRSFQDLTSLTISLIITNLKYCLYEIYSINYHHYIIFSLCALNMITNVPPKKTIPFTVTPHVTAQLATPQIMLEVKKLSLEYNSIHI